MRVHATVVRDVRVVVFAALRVLAGLMIIIALFGPLASWLIEGLIDDDIFSYFSYYIPRIVFGLVILGIGVLLMVFAARISRYLVRVQPEECPKCRFSLEHFRADRCPECGLFLGEDFHAPPKPQEIATNDPASADEPLA